MTTHTLHEHPEHVAVCRLPAGAEAPDWATSLTGVLAELLVPVADVGVSAFTVSTYDTDWILLPAEQAGEAVEALRRRGHVVTSRPSRPTS